MIEVMVAAVVLVTGFLAVASIFTMSKSTTSATRARVQAVNLAREVAEAARGVTYAEITDPGVLAKITAGNPSLADLEAGAPHTVERRNVVYTIAAETCVMDDNRDGGGSAPRTGDFCPESVAAGTADPRTGKPDAVPEDYKRVDVTVSWKRQNGTVTVKQTTLVNNPGSAGAPAVVSLSSPVVGTPPVIGPTVATGGSTTTSIAFSATTSHAPATVSWLLDGVNQAAVCGPCPISKGPFNFTWNLEAPVKADDGPYLISAEAYDERSVAGPSRSMTVVLNRYYPRAPSGLAGGRNRVDGANVIELEWLPNPERDLTGYVVERIETSGTTVICARQMSTYCRDTSPPTAAVVRYRVTPWDVAMDGTTPRASIYSSTVDVVQENRPPNKPAAVLVYPKDADGNVRLTWNKPSPEDPDPTGKIVFYRVYRDGQLLANRIGRVDAAGGTTHVFYDANATRTDHRYWVTSVDNNYAESGFEEAKSP